MTFRELQDALAQSPNIKLVYADESDETFVFRVEDKLPRYVKIPAKDIAENTWEDISGVLERRRPARILDHVTRIVGYYSLLHNWNRSKLAELKDRHKGNYAVPE